MISAIITCEPLFPRLYDNKVLKLMKPVDAYAGLINGGATCYMNATFQQLFMQPSLRQKLISAPKPVADSQVSDVFEAVREIFMELTCGVSEAADPSCFWNVFKDYDNNPVDVREHQDAYEFFTRLQDSIDEYLHSLGHRKHIQDVMGGSFNQIIEVSGHPDVRSERQEDFYQISVDVRGKKNLQDSLESYVAAELLDGQNQWYCEELGKKVDAKKRTLIKCLPQTLVFHFKRFEWDFDTLSRWKIKDRFEFPIELNMEPYVDDQSISQEDILDYDLAGVIVHSGSAFAGHYYSYAKDRGTDKWFRFDDDSVEPWQTESIDEDCFGGCFVPEGSDKAFEKNHSAYIVLYEKKSYFDSQTSIQAFKSGHDQLIAIKDAPKSCRLSLIRENVLEIMKSYMLSPVLSNFCVDLGITVEESLERPRASKATKTKGDSKEARDSIFSKDVIGNKANNVSDLIRTPLGEATVLLLEYCCCVLSRGPLSGPSAAPQARSPDPIIQIIASLKSISGYFIPSLSIVVYFAGGLDLSSHSAVEALAFPSRALRKEMRELLRLSLSRNFLEQINLSKYHTSVVEKVMEQMDTGLEHFPNVIVRWEDSLGALSELVSFEELRNLILPKVEKIHSHGWKVFKLWTSMNKGQRETHDFAQSYTNLMATLLRRFLLPNESLFDDDVQLQNPYLLNDISDKNLVELPEQIIHESVSLGSEALRTILLPGCIRSENASSFIKWYCWRNAARSEIITCSVLEHLSKDITRADELAGEIRWIVEALTIDDGLAEHRLRYVFCHLRCLRR